MKTKFFQALYTQAVESALTIAEPQETANFLIRLLLPYAIFSQKKEEIFPHISLIKSVVTREEIAQSERDYLTRLLIVELIQIGNLNSFFFENESLIDRLASTIESEEERQEVLLSRMTLLSSFSSDDAILEKIEEIEDLSSYEKTILSLLQERFSHHLETPDEIPPSVQDLIDRLETEGSIACGWGKMASISSKRGNFTASKKFLYEFLRHWEQIENEEIQDALLSDLISLGSLPFEQIFPLTQKFHSKVVQAKAWSNFAQNPDTAAKVLPLFQDEIIKKGIDLLPLEDQIVVYYHYAKTAYHGNQRSDARNTVRTILSHLPNITNSIKQVSLYRALITLLKTFSENKAAFRVLSLCAESLDRVTPEDFREFQWRDTFFEWSLLFDSSEYCQIADKYLKHLANADQKIQEITYLLTQTDPGDSPDALLKSLATLPELSPFEKTSRLVRLYRRGAGFALENKGSKGIINTRIQELLFDRAQG